MKSKLTMLIFAGALTLGATAQNAMASGGLGNSPPARAVRGRTVAAFSAKRSTPARAGAYATKGGVTKKASNRAAVPPHTILNGAKNNAF